MVRDRTIDHYEVLGIQQNASTAEIKKAYRKRSLESHPDKNPYKDDAEFKKVNEAHVVLIDPEQRSRYDVVREKINVLKRYLSANLDKELAKVDKALDKELKNELNAIQKESKKENKAIKKGARGPEPPVYVDKATIGAKINDVKTRNAERLYWIKQGLVEEMTKSLIEGANNIYIHGLDQSGSVNTKNSYEGFAHIIKENIDVIKNRIDDFFDALNKKSDKLAQAFNKEMNKLQKNIVDKFTKKKTNLSKQEHINKETKSNISDPNFSNVNEPSFSNANIQSMKSDIKPSIQENIYRELRPTSIPEIVKDEIQILGKKLKDIKSLNNNKSKEKPSDLMPYSLPIQDRSEGKSR